MRFQPKEKIAKDIMRREAEEAANINLNAMNSGNLGSLLNPCIGKNADFPTNSNNKKSNKKNKKEIQSGRDSNLQEKKFSRSDCKHRLSVKNYPVDDF